MPAPARGVVVVLVGGEAPADGLSLLAGPASGTLASHTARALTEAVITRPAGHLGMGSGWWLGQVSALQFRGGADRGDGGVDQVADEVVALVVGGPEGTGQVG